VWNADYGVLCKRKVSDKEFTYKPLSGTWCSGMCNFCYKSARFETFKCAVFSFALHAVATLQQHGADPPAHYATGAGLSALTVALCHFNRSVKSN
jgi:hypothetical protein